MRRVIIGAIYKHYKGNIYQTIEVGRHAESGQKLMVYKGSDHQVWVRPLKEFLGQAAYGFGRPVNRFSLLVGKPK